MSTRIIERMAVELDGDGEPVLALHGLGSSSNFWTPAMPALARHRVLRPDLPGSARSAGVDGPLSIETWVAALRRLLERLEIERVHLLAHSLGSIVAQHLAVQRPQVVRSLVLFGPLAAPSDAARAALRARAASARADGAAGMQAIADSIVAGATSADTRARRPLAVALVRESLMRQPAEAYARSCEALADARPAAVEQLSLPALLVGGDEDAVAPPQSVRALADRLAGSSSVTLPRCGHWTLFERPDECRAELQRWFARRFD